MEMKKEYWILVVLFLIGTSLCVGFYTAAQIAKNLENNEIYMIKGGAELEKCIADNCVRVVESKMYWDLREKCGGDELEWQPV